MTKHPLARPAAIIAAALAVAGLAACDRTTGNTAPASHTKATTTTSTADARAPGLLIGTPPAPPTGDPPGTTPVDKDTTNISKQAETQTMPHEGDNHSYSSVSPDNPQKATKVDAQQTPERTQQ